MHHCKPSRVRWEAEWWTGAKFSVLVKEEKPHSVGTPEQFAQGQQTKETTEQVRHSSRYKRPTYVQPVVTKTPVKRAILKIRVRNNKPGLLCGSHQNTAHLYSGSSVSVVYFVKCIERYIV